MSRQLKERMLSVLYEDRVRAHYRREDLEVLRDEVAVLLRDVEDAIGRQRRFGFSGAMAHMYDALTDLELAWRDLEEAIEIE